MPLSVIASVTECQGAQILKLDNWIFYFFQGFTATQCCSYIVVVFRTFAPERDTIHGVSSDRFCKVGSLKSQA